MRWGRLQEDQAGRVLCVRARMRAEDRDFSLGYVSSKYGLDIKMEMLSWLMDL